MNTLNISEMRLRALNKVSGAAYVTIGVEGAKRCAQAAVKDGYKLVLKHDTLGIFGYEHPDGYMWLFYNIINSDEMVAVHGGGSREGLKANLNLELSSLLYSRRQQIVKNKAQ